MIYSIGNNLVRHLDRHSDDEFFWVSIFRRCLYSFLLLKILLSTSTLSEIVQYQPLLLDSKIAWIGYAPLLLLQLDQYFFLAFFMLLLGIGLILKSNGIISFLIFWFSICLSRLMLPIINGSDSVLNLFLLFSIFMSHRRILDSQALRIISNASLLMAKIQLTLIYFLSGYDKLLSETWKSGAAVFSILRLEFFQNPYLTFDLSPAVCSVLGWTVILFELGFAILIWFKFFRIPLLFIGVLFHLSIIIFLGLLDFGLLMILCYAIFLPKMKDETEINKPISS